MASVGTLAAGVAHEINNPLAYVTANIDMIVERLDDPGVRNSEQELAEVLEMAEDVRDGAERIRKIVLGLKTFSHAGEERLAVIEVQPLIERAIDMTINEVRHRARLVKDFGTTPLVEADESRLGQVIINLLVNASQAIPDGDVAANEVRVVTSTDEQGRAVIEVRDTGVGIPEESISRVFNPFFTTKPVGVGTGLGLSICHNIVAGLGGFLTVTSEEGRGSTFRIVLPAAMALSQKMPTEVAPPPVAEVERAAVLVVDDEPSIGRVLRRVLSEHDVTAVTSAHEGLDLLESGLQFDIIFSDLMMPEMSGMDFYEEIAQRFPALLERVVFVSGGAFTPRANEFLERVPNELVDKPFAQETVRALVRRYGSRQRTG
jgi:CheY-like chemotaxis protein/two-component sensor histidine kinase